MTYHSQVFTNVVMLLREHAGHCFNDSMSELLTAMHFGTCFGTSGLDVVFVVYSLI